MPCYDMHVLYRLFLDVTASGITSSGLCKIILGFITVRVGCGFLFIQRSFLFIVAMVTSRNYPFILVNIDQDQMNCDL